MLTRFAIGPHKIYDANCINFVLSIREKTNWSHFAITNKFIVRMCATTVAVVCARTHSGCSRSLSIWTMKYLWMCILLNLGTSHSSSFNIFRLISCCHRNSTQSFSLPYLNRFSTQHSTKPTYKIGIFSAKSWRTHYFVTKAEKKENWVWWWKYGLNTKCRNGGINFHRNIVRIWYIKRFNCYLSNSVYNECPKIH